MFFVVESFVKFNIGRLDIIKVIIYRYCIDCYFNMFIYKVFDYFVLIVKFIKNSIL